MTLGLGALEVPSCELSDAVIAQPRLVPAIRRRPPSCNCTSAQKPVIIGLLTFSNCTAIGPAVRFGNARNPYFIAFCAPVQFGSPVGGKIALKGVLELPSPITAGTTVLWPDVFRADGESLQQSGQAVLGQRLAVSA